VLRVDVVEVGVPEQPPLHAVVDVPILARLRFLSSSRHLHQDMNDQRPLKYPVVTAASLSLLTKLKDRVQKLLYVPSPRRLRPLRHCPQRLPEAPCLQQHP
jgi:hypothetical protein